MPDRPSPRTYVRLYPNSLTGTTPKPLQFQTFSTDEATAALTAILVEHVNALSADTQPVVREISDDEALIVAAAGSADRGLLRLALHLAERPFSAADHAVRRLAGPTQNVTPHSTVALVAG